MSTPTLPPARQSLTGSDAVTSLKADNRLVLLPDTDGSQGTEQPVANVTLAMLTSYLATQIGGNGGGGAAPTLQSVEISSGTGQVTGSIDMCKLGIVTKMSTDNPARIRLYPTAAERDADLSRDSTTPSPPGDSLLFEGITTSALLSFNTGPTPYVYNGDDPQSAALYYTLEPTALAGAVCTLSYFGFA